MLLNATVAQNSDGAGGDNTAADVAFNGVDDENDCIDG